MENIQTTREGWLTAGASALRPIFEAVGIAVPDTIRFAMAFPSTGSKGKRIGECWSASASEDGWHTIIIRADIAHPVDVLEIQAHELVHAAMPPGEGHGKAFRKAALAIGLTGKMTATYADIALRGQLEAIADRIGPLPHTKLNFAGQAEDKPKKQATRMLKASCECGYTIRLSKLWADAGLPCCPVDQELLELEGAG